MQSIKVAMLFIGAVIGAGFATGREIMIFFRDSDIFTLIFAGIFLGVLCGVFLIFGKITCKLSKEKCNLPNGEIFVGIVGMGDKLLEWSSFVTCIPLFCCMVSGLETIFRDCFSIKYLGLIIGFLSCICCIFSMDFAKVLNAILVPIIVILAFCLAVQSEVSYGGKINLWSAIEYGGMNLLLGGALVSKQAKEMSYKQIFSTSIIVAIVFSFSIWCVYMSSMNCADSPMPIFQFSVEKNCQYIAGIIIILAIFTTLLACGKIIIDKTTQISTSKWIGFACLLCLTASGFRWNFAHATKLVLPVVSVVGVGVCFMVTVIVIVLEIVFFCNKFFQKFHKKIHNSSKSAKGNSASHNQV